MKQPKVGRKRSEYAEAADPEKYRQVDATLFPCRAHGSAAVLCATAGKTGRNGRTAAVGATVFWLTCPFINNMVARLERHSGVQVFEAFVREHPPVLASHIASHEVFRRVVEAQLTAEQFQFYDTHFIHPASDVHIKYGNAAVGHADDFKCLHALVGQLLCGADNPVGLAVVNVILFLYECVFLHKSSPPVNTLAEDAVHELMESRVLMEAFVKAVPEYVFSGEGGGSRVQVVVPLGPLADEIRAHRSGGSSTTVPVVPEGVLEFSYAWRTCNDIRKAADVTPAEQGEADMKEAPDLCEMCRQLIVFLNGKLPRGSKKHRIN